MRKYLLVTYSRYLLSRVAERVLFIVKPAAWFEKDEMESWCRHISTSPFPFGMSEIIIWLFASIFGKSTLTYALRVCFVMSSHCILLVPKLKHKCRHKTWFCRTKYKIRNLKDRCRLLNSFLFRVNTILNIYSPLSCPTILNKQHRLTRTEDTCHSNFVKEVVVLRRNDPTTNHDNITEKQQTSITQWIYHVTLCAYWTVYPKPFPNPRL